MPSRSKVGASATAARHPAGADPSAPILEHDSATEAVIEPTRKHGTPSLPECCVLCFFHDAIATLVAKDAARKTTDLQSEMGPLPVYVFEESGRPLTLAHPGLGAPMAAAFMEELIALGCRRKGIAYRTGKTWTTDGLYRETPGKVARRRAEGCLTVEMECSALCGVARFRDVTFGQILYGGDDVSRLEWDRRGWDRQNAVRARLLHLAAQACLRIPD